MGARAQWRLWVGAAGYAAAAAIAVGMNLRTGPGKAVGREAPERAVGVPPETAAVWGRGPAPAPGKDHRGAGV